MEAVFGIAFKDFALICADTLAASSVMLHKHDCDKIHVLSDTLMMGVVGEAGDTDQFAQYIAKNIQLYKIRNGFELSPKSAALFIQRNLADYLRSRTPYQCNLILAGYDKSTEPEIYYIDHLASLIKVPYAVHGYASMFTYGLLDKEYRPDMSIEEGVELVSKCIKEVQKRFLGSLPSFGIKVLTDKGVKTLPNISVATLGTYK